MAQWPSLLVLVTCLVFVPLTALVVDIGLQRVVVRGLQSLADVVALDLARKLDTSTTVAQWSSRSPSLQDHADDTVERNPTIAGSSARAVPTLPAADGNALVAKVSTILSQLSTSLGLNVAGADVYALSHPSCPTPVLRG